MNQNTLSWRVYVQVNQDHWNRLGSSKSRSVAQQEEAKVTVQNLVETCELNDLLVFTDGSCLGNPGTCGCGACIFIPNQK